MTAHEFLQKCSLPYEAKIIHAQARAREFFEHMDGNVFCSVGGLDSLTLLMFLRRYVSPDIPGVSVSSLEDKSIQAIHATLNNFVVLKPLKSKIEVLKECGYPVISKDKALKIQIIQNPTEKNQTMRHAIMTGVTGERGGWRTRETGSFFRLPQKWLELFGGPENERYGTHYRTAPFKVSPDCCYWMKERPCNIYSRESGRKPYLGLMASEGGRRRISLMKNGCNYYGKIITRSCPFAILSRDDLLRLVMELEVPVPQIYGRIERDEHGKLFTTEAQRTGCTMCGFGIHIEKRPHRFDRLRRDNPTEWSFWMYDQGWGRVLDYIGVEWENDPERDQLALFTKAVQTMKTGKAKVAR